MELHDPESLEYLERLILENQLKLWKIKEDVKVAFTVTDNFIALGLSMINGRYDNTKLLLSGYDDMLKWGDKLFEYYLEPKELI